MTPRTTYISTLIVYDPYVYAFVLRVRCAASHVQRVALAGTAPRSASVTMGASANRPRASVFAALATLENGEKA